MLVMFYAEPTSLSMTEQLKTVGDYESDCAKWVTTAELLEMKKNNELRFDDLLDWALWLEKGGQIIPIGLLGTKIPSPP